MKAEKNVVNNQLMLIEEIMKNFKYLLKLFTLIILISSVTTAQTTERLNLKQSIQIGLENNRFIHASEMKVLYAKSRLSELNTFKLPSLKLNATYSKISEVDQFVINTPFGTFDLAPQILDRYNITLSLQQPLFTGFRLKSNSEAAEYGYKAAEELYNADKQSLIFNIENAYWNLFKAKEIKKLIYENYNLIEAHLKDVENLFEQGMATSNDVLKIKVQLGQMQLNKIDAKNAVDIAILAFKNVLGISLSENIDIEDNLEPDTLKSIPDLNYLLEEAYSVRPQLKAAEFQVEASESGITAAKSNWYPQIYLIGNYQYAQPNPRIFPAREQFEGTWDINLSLSFDLWNWGANSDRTSQAEAEFEQAKDNVHLLRDAITLEIKQNYLDLIKSEQKIKVASLSIKQAEENYRITKDKFVNGLVINSELLDAEVALLQAKTNKVEALVDYKISLAKLRKSIGSENI